MASKSAKGFWGRVLGASTFVVALLHDTFPQAIQTVQAKENKAELELVAWGSFTVCVLADGGKTKLELDLSQIESAPADWRAR